MCRTGWAEPARASGYGHALASWAGHMPGGLGEVHASWPSEDEMALEISAMGQSIPARLEIMEEVVRVHISLPPMLAYFSGIIGAAVRDQGTKLLT